MPHEPSRSCLPVQPTGDRRCPFCRTVKPHEDFHDSASTLARCCGSCSVGTPRSLAATGSGPCGRSPGAPRLATAPCSPSNLNGGGDGA